MIGTATPELVFTATTDAAQWVQIYGLLRPTDALTVIASRVGVNDLEEHLRQKRLRWFGHTVRRDEEIEIKCWS